MISCENDREDRLERAAVWGRRKGRGTMDVEEAVEVEAWEYCE